ncbi:MAG: hypothetical protein M1836_002097 [Candelina mexicana]|nr:MAG: hypothetical protein M1836_002097 [Candelina mexicana]
MIAATTASSNTPFGFPILSPPSVGQTMPPLLSSQPRSPRPLSGRKSTSPNYFSLVSDPTFKHQDSHHAGHIRSSRSPPSSNARPAVALSPTESSLDASLEFDAFRARSEATKLNLGHGTSSHFSRDSGQRPGMGRNNSSHLNQSTPQSPRTVPISSPTERGESHDRMELDTVAFSGEPPPRPSQSPRSRKVEDASFFDLPRQDSPAILPASDTPNSSRTQISHLDDKHPRLSLPQNRVNPPSPSDVQKQRPQRAETMPPSLNKDSPAIITPQNLIDLLNSSLKEILLLDLRVYPQYSHSRISGALNLCIPTTLLKRPSFNLQKLADTFTNEEEKKKFVKWKECQFIIAYDASSSQLKDATSAINTLKKFSNEGWSGHSLIVRGGFVEFSKLFPTLIDQRSSNELTTSIKSTLSIEPPMPGIAPVAGGCPMPSTKTVANPFFGNIRQNMDLIGGVGQMPIQHPANMTDRSGSNLPSWLRQASDEKDRGKAVSESFLGIEKAEQRRMQEALSGNVSYGSPGLNGPKSIQIAGIEKGAKNRYNNIWPYDHSRVKLQGVPSGSCDYVNANHVRAAWSSKSYIATQGPIPTTFDDFWRVVWEQDVRVIVMLTAETEGGQLKCHTYWSGHEYGPLKLTFHSEKKLSLETNRPVRPGPGRRRSTDSNIPEKDAASLGSDRPHVIIRKFALAHDFYPFQPMREITQIQYSNWPDFGAPAHPAHVLGLVEHCNAAVRAANSPVFPPRSGVSDPPRDRPVLVHCSAGCGRTGTFCTVDTVIDMLKRQRSARLTSVPENAMRLDSHPGEPPTASSDTPNDDDNDWIHRDDQDLIAKTVEDFRDQRLSMVQSLRQYVLCYETVLEWFAAQPTAAEGGREGVRWSYHG